MRFEKNKLNLDEIYQNIKKTCQAVGRAPDAASLLVVSKNQPVEAILPLLKAGHRFFGENRVQEANAKWLDLRKQYPSINLHLIGPLQTNKTKQALELFDVLESVDRSRLVLALAKNWKNPVRRTRKILIQVNTGHERQKSGVIINDLPALVDLCHAHNLPLTGLMCIPPVLEDPSPHFQCLSDLAQKYQLPDLSMGMSRDYSLAIAKGATWVRIGSALFRL